MALDYRGAVLAGGASGPAIAPGKPDKSLLIQAIRHAEDAPRMPEDNPKLSPRMIADFEKWIEDGAFDPRDQAPNAAELAEATSWAARLEKRKKLLSNFMLQG